MPRRLRLAHVVTAALALAIAGGALVAARSASTGAPKGPRTALAKVTAVHGTSPANIKRSSLAAPYEVTLGFEGRSITTALANEADFRRYRVGDGVRVTIYEDGRVVPDMPAASIIVP